MEITEIELTPKQRAELEQLFPFEYKGGGYFRLKGVPQGTGAPLLHGMQAVEYLYDQLRNNNAKEAEEEIALRTHTKASAETAICG